MTRSGRHYLKNKPYYHAKHWAWVLKSKYGITPLQYAQMANSQLGMCAICKTDVPGKRVKKLSVDHNHSTGIVRGLLCQSCNVGVGFLDKAGWLSAASKYLRLEVLNV